MVKPKNSKVNFSLSKPLTCLNERVMLSFPSSLISEFPSSDDNLSVSLDSSVEDFPFIENFNNYLHIIIFIYII